MFKIVLEGYIEVPEECLPMVREALLKHIELTRKESGCLVFNVKEDPKHENRFHVYEEFVSEAAFDLHQKRVRDSRWGGITKNAIRQYHVERVLSAGGSSDH